MSQSTIAARGVHDILRGSRGEWRALTEAGLGSALIAVLTLAGAFGTRVLYDRVLPANDAVESLIALGMGFVIVLGFEATLRILRSRMIEGAASTADERSATLLIGRILRTRFGSLPPAQAVVAGFGAHDALRDARGALVATTVWDTAFAALLAAVVGWLAGPLVLVPIVAGLGVLGVSLASLAALRRTQKRLGEASARRARMLADISLGAEDLKLMRAEGQLAARGRDASTRVARLSAKMRDLGNIAPSAAAVASTASSLAIVAFGIAMVQSGSLTLGGLYAASMLGGRVVGPFLGAAAVLQKLARARSAMVELRPLAEAPAETEGDIAPETVRGDLTLSGLRFCWPGQSIPVLDGFSLSIPAGDRVALIGASGGGKTTVARLAARLCDPLDGGGLVALDGVDVRRLRLTSLRKHVGVLPQVPYLIAGSVLDNLRLAAPEASAEAIQAALRISGAERWLALRPEGPALQVGERGMNLSAGQRQTLALARVILADPRVVVLDEPTSHLDQDSEAAVVASLDTWLAGRTLLLITHRTAPLRLCSRAAVMQAGKIATVKTIEVRG